MACDREKTTKCLTEENKESRAYNDRYREAIRKTAFEAECQIDSDIKFALSVHKKVRLPPAPLISRYPLPVANRANGVTCANGLKGCS